ncbi:MAG: polysaccharide pyruvyl transferase CsaB [Armatimonadetes bacterium 55-13]|nr:polysaccharide pyruvyl transferase CsaB [Armatimonadota bacterium]OJU64658.1 MAG: polysaccharide pyruvyl transferase CsaB [Armatimonadetes bacterium 55-13]
MANLLLAGYFGAGNLGDDAILLGFIHGLGNTSHNVTVMSGSPEETNRNYGLRSFDRRDLNAYKTAIESHDVLVFPGGSIFQDASSVKSVAYYGQLVKIAKSKGKKVVFLGQGVGPLTTFLGKRWAASAFGMADAICVRDPDSMSTLKALGVNRPIRVTADNAFLLPQPAESDVQGFNVGGMKAVGISVRPHGKKDEIKNLFGELARLLFQAQIMPVFIEMDRMHDGPLISEISKAQGGKIPDMRKVATPMQLQQRMGRLESVIAMRLHAGILAATMGVPPFMVSYDPKVTAFAKLLGIQAAPNVTGLSAQRLFESFMAFMKDREKNEAIMRRKQEEMRQLAQQNIEILEGLVPGSARI